MKTLHKVTITPKYVNTIPEDLEENVIYISEMYKVSVHNCLCGCKSKTVLPINCIIEGKDMGWQLTKNQDNTISFTPSIGNYQLPCQSHYVITNNIARFLG